MSNEIKLFIAQTLDGYIARADGALDWLDELASPQGEDYGYANFLTTISTIIMGRNTYQQILSFGVDWPYAEQKTIIFTTNKTMEVSTPNTEISDELNTQYVQKIKDSAQGNIWIVGGGKLIQSFLAIDAIDEMIISQVPRILGQGIRLFPEGTKETPLQLVTTTNYDKGVINLKYRRRKQ